jgi:hypothetical protein
MVTLARRVNRTPMAPVVGVMFGLVAAILVAAMPGWMFDRLVVQTGLPSILRFAAPPLGLTARVLAMAVAAIVVGGVLWLVIGLIEKALAGRGMQRALWYDAGYSAVEAPVTVEGPRRPIFAPAELGAPLMSDEAIAANRPMDDMVEYADFDVVADDATDSPVDVTADKPIDEPAPAPIEEWIQPMIEPASVASWRTSQTPLPQLTPEPELEVPLSAAEFDLPASDTPEDDDDSIESLIRRLESGLARRAANDPGPDAPARAPMPLTLSKEWIIADKAQSTEPDEGNDDIRQALGALHKFASR